MGFLSVFRASAPTAGYGLAEIYHLGLREEEFVKADIRATYVKILTDVAERTHGLKDEHWKHLWDSCVQGESNEGLISMVADAMLNKADLFIVYKPSVEVLRRADDVEEKLIRDDYKAEGKSSAGVWASFKNYRKTDILRVYSAMEFCVLSSLYKSVNVARAVQIKMSEMRASVSLSDADKAVLQAKALADALRSGNDIMLDAKDSVSTSTPDIDPAKQAIAFLDAKRAWHLSLPLAYISGLQTGGIGASGDADARAIDRGLKPYALSDLHPVMEAVFDVDVEFRPEDTRQVEAGLEVIKGLELVSDDLLSRETKRTLVARAFDVDPIEEAKRIEDEAAERGSDTTLNGAQVTAMSTFLDQLATGSLAPDTAIKALMVAFAMSEEDAEGIVLPMKAFKPKVAPQPKPAPFGGQPPRGAE